MKILSLDQSTTAVGVSLFDGEALVDYVLLKPKASKKITELQYEYDSESHIYSLKMPSEMCDVTLLRITVITDVLEKIIKKEKPDIVYFEDIYENRNPNGFKSLARLQGFIAHLCHKYGIPYKIVNESEWIQAWGTYDNKVKREERKADVMNKVNALYGTDITINDISDSIGIGKYAIEKENLNGKLY